MYVLYIRTVRMYVRTVHMYVCTYVLYARTLPTYVRSISEVAWFWNHKHSLRDVSSSNWAELLRKVWNLDLFYTLECRSSEEVEWFYNSKITQPLQLTYFLEYKRDPGVRPSSVAPQPWSCSEGLGNVTPKEERRKKAISVPLATEGWNFQERCQIRNHI